MKTIKFRASLGKLLLLGAILGLPMPTVAQPASTWKYDAAANQFDLTVPQGTAVNYYRLEQPYRVVLEVGNTILGGNPIRQNYSTGALKSLQVAQIQGGKIRIILELSDGVFDPANVTIQQEPAPVTQGAFLDRWVVRAISTPFVPGLGKPPSQIPTLSTLPTRSLMGIGAPMPEASESVSVKPFFPTPEPVVESPPAVPATTIELPTEMWTPPAENPTVTVPPLAVQTSLRPASLPSLDFNSSAPLPAVASSTELKLRYPEQRSVELEEEGERQEVLVLVEALRDGAGNIIAPAGTPVIGRLETNRRGTKFVAQAVTIGGRNRRFEAESERIGRLFILKPGQIFVIPLTGGELDGL